ncbi:MAG TPA: biotin synthase BioB [Gammaproteobacteria bacterium]|jgi:biotin synthase|nr:biotin synthase BioB [Gammaproteobacteria bacterium]
MAKTRQWDKETVGALFNLPFIQLMSQAIATHVNHFKADEMECCTLLSIKTGTCPEDCAYCPQSGHYDTNVERERLLPLDEVITQAKAAKANGAKRFCMGAAWRNPPKKDFPKVLEMIKAVREVGLETCVTLGMLDEEQAEQLQAAGLHFYNHNLDTSPDYYKKIISTRTYDDRLTTLEHVRNAGIQVCCGGIIGMGEKREDRVELLVQLANLPEPPKSIPINKLIPIAGTPLANTPEIDNIEFVRTIAAARIMMPTSIIRLSAGRISFSEEMQTLCFLAGANSIWLGDKLLTAQNPDMDKDVIMLAKLGMKPLCANV